MSPSPFFSFLLPLSLPDPLPFPIHISNATSGIHSEITGLAEASIKGQWEFGKKRGALLIMARPRSRRIPPHVVLKQLVKIPSLEDKVLVTEVLSCPAYSLYLSGASKCPSSRR